MKLALYQTDAALGTPTETLDRIAGWLAAAAAAGARMLVLPELLLPGYNRPEAHAATAQPRDGAWMARAADLARDTGCGLTLGWAERTGDTVYNAATAFGPDGSVLAHYRKIQLFGAMERASFAPGRDAPPVFTLDGRVFGLLICYDIEFPGHVAALARRGAEAVLVPTANPAGFEHVQRVLVPARAHENRQFVAYANYCGGDGGLDFGGLSLVAGPDAGVLAAAGPRETLLVVDLPTLDDYPTGLLSAQDRDYRPVGD